VPTYDGSDPETARLIELLKTASKEEGHAIERLANALKLRTGDFADLTRQMEAAHNRKLDIYDQLQARRLDK
jgi:hypothetical protein